MTTRTAQLATTPAADAIRPFRVNIPETALADLRRRLAQTRLPEKETVTDYSQGVPLKTIQQLLRHWQTKYDWRKVEARLNAYRTSSPRSTGWTSTSSTSAPSMRMPCR